MSPGPVAQIALMKQELVSDEKWIPIERFNRVYAVYQILPGPEATELACYFGYLAKGRLGSLIGGVGFLLPGWLLMLLCSYLYVQFGLDNTFVQRSFRCLECAVAAIIFKAVYKLADGALKDKDKQFSWEKGFLFMFCFLCAVIGLNFFISLAVAGIMHAIFEHDRIPHRRAVVLLIASATIGFYILYVILNGVPNASLIGTSGSSSISGTSYSSLLELGLVAGCVTFGGAYTTMPFVYAAAVTAGGWLTPEEFLAAIAITNMLPTPLVTFITMVGYIGHGIGGAVMTTIGIFLPAFSFTLIGHELFEKIVENDWIEPFLDGVSAAVIGLLLQTALQFVRGVISDPIDCISFLLAFAAVFHFTDRNTPVFVMVFAAMAGQILYQGVDE